MNHTEGSFTQVIEGLQREAGMTEDEAKSAVNGLLEQEARSRNSSPAIGGKQARKERRARERRTAKTARRTEQAA